MQRLTEEQIKEINNECPYNQGIFFEPYKFPNHLKGQRLLYSRWKTGGYAGGNCWNDNEPTYYHEDEPKDNFIVLDITLKLLKPDMTFLEYREIERLIENDDYCEYEYYGNSNDYNIEYLPLEKLYQHLGI